MHNPLARIFHLVANIRIWERIVTLRTLITYNWAWKLIAAVLATILFTSVRSTISYRQTLALPVEAISIEGDQALTGFEPSLVNITFRGTEAAIRKLALPGAEPPRIRLKLKQPLNNASSMPIKISRSNIVCDSGLRVIAIEPKTVLASFDSSDTRTIDVAEPIVSGAPDNTSVVVKIEPKTVELTGSRLLLDELEAAQTPLATALLDVSGRTEAFETVLKVYPPDNRGGWTLKPNTVRAEISFVKEDTERTFKKVPVRILQSTKGQRYLADTETVEVTLQGARRELYAIEPSTLIAIVSDNDHIISTDASRIECEPQLFLPCTNSVNRVEVKPPHIWLTPITKDLHQ